MWPQIYNHVVANLPPLPLDPTAAPRAYASPSLGADESGGGGGGGRGGWHRPFRAQCWVAFGLNRAEGAPGLGREGLEVTALSARAAMAVAAHRAAESRHAAKDALRAAAAVARPVDLLGCGAGGGGEGAARGDGRSSDDHHHHAWPCPEPSRPALAPVCVACVCELVVLAGHRADLGPSIRRALAQLSDALGCVRETRKQTVCVCFFFYFLRELFFF